MPRLSIVVINVLICTIVHTDGANILALFPLPSRSHFIMFERLLKHLAEKGHNIDVATHFPSKQIPENYTQLSLEGTLPLFVNNFSVKFFREFSDYRLMHFIMDTIGTNACAATLNSPVLKQLKNTTKKYDLVVTEIFGTDCMLGFGHLFNVPTISMTSSVNLPWGSHRFGNPDNPSYIPTYFAVWSGHMNFFERLQNTITLLLANAMYFHWYSDLDNQIAKNFFGPTLPSLEQLSHNTSLHLINTHFSANEARPNVPSIVEVGGLHIYEPKPLSKHFEDLVTTDTKGIIYLTLGSMFKSESFDLKKLQGMFDAFAQLPYKVLWKAAKENLPKGLNVPKNIHFEKWMPQMDLLCHPNVKLFVSHGGLMGGQETIYCGVPRLGIPIFADQEHNIHVSEKIGITIRVGYDDISKETILSAAQKLLNDPVYKQNAVRASKMFRDRPMSALDTATYWVEYVIRHKGAPQLRSVGANLPWYQYYLIDVALVLISVLFVTIYIVTTILKYTLQFIISSSQKMKQN